MSVILMKKLEITAQSRDSQSTCVVTWGQKALWEWKAGSAPCGGLEKPALWAGMGL